MLGPELGAMFAGIRVVHTHQDLGDGDYLRVDKTMGPRK